jgi:cysteine-rich repeat protein
MSMVGSGALRLQGAVLLAGAVWLPGCLNSEIAVTTETDTGSSGTGTTGAPTSSSSGETPTEASSSSTSSGEASSSSSGGEASSGEASSGSSTGQPAAVCGDGMVEVPETCDDGNTDDTDECPASCTPAFCGDGFVRAGLEACDDGNKINDDECTSACTVAVCGDGVAQLGVEPCDDGDKDDSDYCSSTCQFAVCGDGLTRAGVEDCDDANVDETDACLSDCSAASCGDGHVQVGVEDCDDANPEDTDDCPTTCAAAKCGDGFVHAGVETCDDGNLLNADACSNKCLPTPKTLQLGAGALTQQYGDTKVGLAYLDACPQGQVLIGFTGSLKTNVHALLGGLCGTPTLTVVADAFVVKVAAGAALPARGGAGDTPWMRSCPADQVVTGFSGRAGVALDQLTLSCAPLVVSEAMGGTFSVAPGPASPLPAVGGAGGLAFAQTDCPAGQVGNAQNLRADAMIRAFGLGCASVSLGN